MGALPGLLLRGAEDRAEGDADPGHRRPAAARGPRAPRRSARRSRPAARPTARRRRRASRRPGRPPPTNRRSRSGCVAAAPAAETAFTSSDVVELAPVVEGLRGRPGAHHDLEVLVGAPVALLLVEVVAVVGLLGLAAAGDDVDGDVPAREPAQPREARAATVGTITPGRCATRYPSRSECAAAKAATCSPSADDALCPTSTLSNPASSWAPTKRRTKSGSIAGPRRRMDLRGELGADPGR